MVEVDIEYFRNPLSEIIDYEWDDCIYAMHNFYYLDF